MANSTPTGPAGPGTPASTGASAPTAPAPPTYDIQSIEAKWQARWREHGSYQIANDDPRPPYYVLCMYPYPSGSAHMGHVRNYTIGDVLVRYRTMQGDGVLSPLGFDSFGLPAENAAIATGEHPRSFTDARIAELLESLERMGAVYDHRRRLMSHDPRYMRWTQWLFLRLWEAGLAYRGSAPVNFCPGCQTVLANEQVLPDGTCERSKDPVEKRVFTQWFFRITEYVQELLDDMEQLEWPEQVKAIQRNWIGRSPGVEFTLEVMDGNTDTAAGDGTTAGDASAADGPTAAKPDGVRVFTTRPDTSFGMTFAVMSPEHPRVDELTTPEQAEAVQQFVHEVAQRSDIERLSVEGPADRRGVATGTWLRNPFNGRAIPLFLADYVLMGYGTGAVMGVPGEDQRDWEFAEAHQCDIIRTVEPPADWQGQAWTGEGKSINSEWLNGLDIAEAKQRAIDWLQEQGLGEPVVNYRLRDWGISRQRFWGCPIPVIHCPDCGPQPVPEADLPVLLPEVADFLPTGESPLNRDEQFLNTTCPACGGPAERETDTFDTFVDSSWYFMWFTQQPDGADVGADADPVTPVDPATPPFTLKSLERWMPVDQYIGGIEHAVMHLIYARFFTKALSDLGIAPPDLREPFARLFNQGMILKDGAKMSKSKGNLVSPIEILDTQGADALRLAHLQVKPPQDNVDWEDFQVEGCAKFLARVWRLAVWDAEVFGQVRPSDRPLEPPDQAIASATHRFIHKVTSDLDKWSYNTAVAACMEFTNALYKYVQSSEIAELGGPQEETFVAAMDALLLVLAPMVPHIAAELWELRHGADATGADAAAGTDATGADTNDAADIHRQPWPQADPEQMTQERCVMVVQVNGKLRDRLEVDADITQEAALELALASSKVAAQLDGKEPGRVIARLPNLLNLVV